MGGRLRCAARRRLRRNVSKDGGRAVEVARVLAIRGGVRKTWMVLPMEQVAGRDCVSLSSTSGWIMHLLDGCRRSTQFQGALANFVRECAATFDAARTAQGSSASSHAPLQDGADGAMPPLQDGADSGQAPRRAAGRGRFMDSDDEAEVKAAAVRVPLAKAKPVKQSKRRKGEFANLTVKEIPMTFTVTKGPRILLPADELTLERIVEHLMPRRGEPKQAASQAGGGSVKPLVNALDKGRIWWRSSTWRATGAWTIRYKGAGGEVHKTCAGLRVPTESLSGDTLDPADYQKAIGQVLNKARREWNRLDCSEHTRYQVLPHAA